MEQAILFADISGSTKLFETLGDDRARAITSRCLNLLSQITTQHKGRVIKTIGDEIMCTLPTADLAGDAAIRMQEEVKEQTARWETHVRIRIGFHFGDVIEEKGDVFGDAVNMAARMASQSKADQIITNGETLARMDPVLRRSARFLVSDRVKGKEQPVEIFELTWGEVEELTIMGGGSAKEALAATGGMRFSFQNKVFTVNEASPMISMGRGADNILCVPDTMASRSHVMVEYRRGKLFLVDKSTNGTYVTLENGGVEFVHRTEFMLEGNGVIGLGQKVTPEAPLAVHFQSL